MTFKCYTPKYEKGLVVHVLLILAAAGCHPNGCIAALSSGKRKIPFRTKPTMMAFHSQLWHSKTMSSASPASASTTAIQSFSPATQPETQDGTTSSTTSTFRIPPKPQIVQFREPSTNTKVLLIGTMHYNPTSINMVQSTIESLAQTNNLASVIIESCDVRYNATQELLSTPQGQVFAPVLTSEMSVAKNVAFDYDIPCILGDQRINVTGDSLKETLQSTFVDLKSGVEGWKKLKSEFQEAAEVAVPVTGSREEGYLNVGSILDPRLVLAAPVSFIKYPLSFLARNPISTLAVFAFLSTLTVLENASAQSMMGDAAASYVPQDVSIQDQIMESLASLTFSVVEFGLFGRLMVQVLLKERNEVLAQNILDQCRIYSPDSRSRTSTTKQRNPFDIASFLFGSKSQEKQDDITSPDTIYVPGSSRPNGIVDEKEKVVVAVLGMAHCNGIVKLLREQRLVQE